MWKRFVRWGLVILFFGFTSFTYGDTGLPALAAEALQKYSIRFDSVVNDFYSGGLVGNGRIGASVYKEKGDTLCWELGCTEVRDHRPRYNWNDPKDILYTACRLPIGKLQLPMAGNRSDMVMDLYKAEVKGNIGQMKWRTYTPACHDVLVVEWEGPETLPDMKFCPAVSQSPRAVFANAPNKPEGYRPNPAPECYVENGYNVCKQPLLAGGEYTTVWKVKTREGKRQLLLAIGYSQTNTHTEQEAMRKIESVEQAGKKAEQAHLEWWHNFYARSYVSVGEDRFDAFFWSQLYKLGSATRTDGLPIDLMGPWYHHHTPWPAIWWNLNIQLTYSPMFAINHTELVMPLLDMLDNQVENLKKNVPEAYRYNSAAIGRMSSYDCLGEVEKEHGLLMWTLFYYWKYYRYTLDEERLKDRLFPLLKLAVNYYRYLLTEGEDGYLHLPVSFSPEYAEAPDCNFELALLRWGCETLLHTNDLCRLKDTLAPQWQFILDKLTPYPADEDGFLIGKGVKLKNAHRHYSHLLMLYPLGNFSMDTPENRALAERSMLYWLGFKEKNYYMGYTYTGASSMYTLLGNGEEAYRNLAVVLDRYIQPNTLYRESGPVFETPMSALASFTEMLLLSRDSVISVMPALPAHWKNVCYRGLRAEGGIEVSACRQEGVLHEVRLRSLYGKSCVFTCEVPVEQLEVKGADYKILDRFHIYLKMQKGKEVLVKKSGKKRGKL